jgi:integrase
MPSRHHFENHVFPALGARPISDIPARDIRVVVQRSIYRYALELLILTAVRFGELRGARWKEMDDSRPLWRVPERMNSASFITTFASIRQTSCKSGGNIADHFDAPLQRPDSI